MAAVPLLLRPLTTQEWERLAGSSLGVRMLARRPHTLEEKKPGPSQICVCVTHTGLRPSHSVWEGGCPWRFFSSRPFLV